MSNLEIIIDFAYNVALLLAASVIYTLMPKKRFEPAGWQRYAYGIVISIIGVVIMSRPYVVLPGVQFDARSLVVAITAMFMGVIPTVIAASLLSAYRLMMGGDGAYVGVMVIASSAVIGLAWRKLFFNKLIKSRNKRFLNIYMTGIVVHLAYIVSLLALPGGKFREVFLEVHVPLLLVYPVGFVILGMVLFSQYDKLAFLKELEETKDRIYTYVEEAPYGIFITDMKGRFLEANRKALEMSGYSIDGLRKETTVSITDPSNPEELMNSFSTLLDKGYMDIDKKYITADKGSRVWNVRGVLLGKDRTLSFCHDITDEIKTRHELLMSEQLHRAVFEQSSIGIFFMNPEGRIIRANEAFCHLMGYSENELQKKSYFDITHPEDVEKSNRIFMETLKNGTVSKEFEKRYVVKDGNVVHVLVSNTFLKDEGGNPVYSIKTVVDLTEKLKLAEENKLLEASMRNQQKLESIGTLAGGVAHEINNPINGILNYGQLILDSPCRNSEIHEYAGEIIFESNRVAKIVKNLLAFSRHDEEAHISNSIDEIMKHTISLIKTIMKKDQIRMDVNISEGIPHVVCRSQQIQQVVMNLLTNARDALNKKYPGYDKNKRLEISCREETKEGRRVVVIRVRDNGSGIKDDIAEKIFDPFFTTKGRSNGTGLGLAISYGIIKEHGGEIGFVTKEGEYTEFLVLLPAEEDQQEETNSSTSL